jgi:hypothetical protein
MFRAKPFAASRELWKGEVGAFTVIIAKGTDKKHAQKFHILIGVQLGNDCNIPVLTVKKLTQTVNIYEYPALEVLTV